jgi:hypothetical protein
MVSPIKAAGALIGFAAGFAATYRSGGAISDSIYHGMFMVREGIKANVAEQQRAYQSKLLRAQRQVAEQMQAGGMVLPPAMQELLRSTPPQLGPGSG